MEHWITTECGIYKLSLFETARIAYAASHQNAKVEFAPDATEEDKKRLRDLIAWTAGRLQNGATLFPPITYELAAGLAAGRLDTEKGGSK